MNWLDVLKVVAPIVISVATGTKVVATKIKQGKRIAFLTACANVVYFRVEWEKTLPSPPPGWESGDLKVPQNARLRSQMLIGELCGVSGQPAPDLKETQFLDKFFHNLAKASKYGLKL